MRLSTNNMLHLTVHMDCAYRTSATSRVLFWLRCQACRCSRIQLCLVAITCVCLFICHSLSSDIWWPAPQMYTTVATIVNYVEHRSRCRMSSTHIGKIRVQRHKTKPNGTRQLETAIAKILWARKHIDGCPASGGLRVISYRSHALQQILDTKRHWTQFDRVETENGPHGHDYQPNTSNPSELRKSHSIGKRNYH